MAFVPQTFTYSKTIITPEDAHTVIADIPLLDIDATWAPGGITIIKAGLKTDADSTYSVTFQAWTTSDTSTSDRDTLSTVATSSSAAADSGAITQNVDTDEIVFLGLPATTGSNFIEVWFTYILR